MTTQGKSNALGPGALLRFLFDRRGPIVAATVAAGSLFLVIYLGAWAVSKDVQASALARPDDALVIGSASARESGAKLAWWEDGLLLACPLH